METLLTSLKHNHDLIKLEIDDNPIKTGDRLQIINAPQDPNQPKKTMS